MLTDFDAGAMVIVPAGDGALLRVPVRSLLPLPYQR
jgi:nitrate/nitrite transporter NarK